MSLELPGIGSIIPQALHDFAGTSRFEVRRQLGQGGTGVVYEAWDRERRLAVALKTLREIDANALYRLKNEFRALRGLQHPNLVSLGELIEDAGHWFFTMELVDGVDFLEWVREDAEGSGIDRASHVSPSADTLQGMRPRLTQKAAPMVNFDQLRVALGQLARGLGVLHDAGKVHRDVKPSNVLVDAQGRLVLLDFGLIWDMSDGHRRSMRHVVGTPEYMAPEQATGDAVGPPADWYSVGVLLYESLCGRAPFEGPPMRVLLEKQQRVAAPPSQLVDNVPEDLDELTSALLQFDPEARPSGTQVLRALGLGASTPRSYPGLVTQTSVFVGRGREEALLDAAFQDVTRGACSCVAVCGESGLGKSTLVRHFSRQLEESGRATVLSGACYENELVPYKAVDGAVDDLAGALARLDAAVVATLLPRHVDLIARMFPVLGRVDAIARARVSPTGHGTDPHEQRARAIHALRKLLVALGKRAPLVLLIDDVQWADLDSVRLLQRLLAPPDPPRLLLLLTARTRDAVERFGLVAPSRIIDLAPLTPAAALELTHQLAMRADGSGMLGEDVIAADAGGHPFFIQELVRYAALSGKPTGGVSVDDAIRARAGDLEPAGRRLLELLSVSGAPLLQSVLRVAAGLEPHEFTRQRAILCAVNLARLDAGSRDTLALYHSRVGEAMRGAAGVDPPALHAQLATALERSGVAEQQPELVVQHLEQAGDAARAGDYARRAAERAEAQFAFDRAAALYRTALRVGHFASADTHALRMALGHSLVNTGRGPEAAEVFLEASDHEDPVIQLDCRRLAAEQLLISGHIERGLQMLEKLLVDIGTPLPRTPARTVAALLWQRLRLHLRGLGWKPRSASQVTRESLIRLDAHHAVSHGLSMVDYVRGALFNARHLRLALDGGDMVRIGDALAQEAVFIGCRGGRGMARAQRLADLARELGERSQDAKLQAFAVACDGALAYFAGRFGEGASKLSTGSEMLERVPVTDAWELTNTRLFQIFDYGLMGALKAARGLSERYLADADSRGDAYFGTSLRRVSVYFELAGGNVTGARERLASATWPANPVWFHIQSHYELEARAQLALYEGDADAALAALEPTFAQLQSSPLARIQIVRVLGLWLRATLALSCERLPVKRALRLAGGLARRLERERISYASSMAELVFAGMAQRSGHLELARERWARAVALADAGETSAYAAAARFRLGTLIGGDEGATLVQAAGAWATAQGVVSERCFDMIAARPLA